MSDEHAGHSPIGNVSDDRAALYYGHLIAQAEDALGDGTREDQIALCWLAGHVISSGAHSWSAHYEGMEMEGRRLGDWSLRAVVLEAKKEPIALARRAWLTEDGRQIMALAHPFVPDTGDVVEATNHLLGFCAMRLVASLKATEKPIIVQDAQGHAVALTILEEG